ncbi:MAG: Smr/MutS family protein [Chitinophagales bacterium]|jgi:dsDNA-specific endonuclease/ATPase MutS2
MAKIVVDLHDCFDNGTKIDAALNNAIEEALDTKTRLVEIIPGKGSGQLKKRVLRFLEQKHIKRHYHRIEKDSKNFGRLFVHFKC